METPCREERQKLHVFVTTDTSVDRSEEEREEMAAQKKRRQKTKANETRTGDIKSQSEAKRKKDEALIRIPAFLHQQPDESPEEEVKQGDEGRLSQPESSCYLLGCMTNAGKGQRANLVTGTKDLVLRTRPLKRPRRLFSRNGAGGQSALSLVWTSCCPADRNE